MDKYDKKIELILKSIGVIGLFYLSYISISNRVIKGLGGSIWVEGLNAIIVGLLLILLLFLTLIKELLIHFPKFKRFSNIRKLIFVNKIIEIIVVVLIGGILLFNLN